MDRYYVSSSGGGGWAKCHVIYDRSTTPPTCIAMNGRWHMGKLASAKKACEKLNAETDPNWTMTPAERDALTRLREWAATTKAFTEHAYDPNAAPALVRDEALREAA